MTYPTPTTEEELNELLWQIDEDIRYRKEDYEAPVLNYLTLEKIDYQSKSDTELLTQAQELSNLKKTAELQQETSVYQGQILALQAELSLTEVGLTEKLKKIDAYYDESQVKLAEDVAEKNMSSSSAYLSAKTKLESMRNSEKTDAETLASEKKAVIQGKIDEKQYLINNLNSVLTQKYQAVTEELFRELKEKENVTVNEVLKYNNQIEEKLIKTNNSVNQSKTRLNLEYLLIVNESLTKEELDALGYYKEMIKQVDGFYYTLDGDVAYEMFCKNSLLVYYLGEYYSSMHAKYEARAKAYA